MDLALKFLFYLISGINGLVGLLFFLATLAAIFNPTATQANPSDNYVVAIGSATILCLLGWAFHLAILQGRMAAGFGVAALSYLIWVLIQLAIIVIISIKGNWSWQ
jgi:hypothetical protein